MRPRGLREWELPIARCVETSQAILDCTPTLWRDVGLEVLEQIPEATHDLDRARTIDSDLVDAERDQVVPRRRRVDDARVAADAD